MKLPGMPCLLFASCLAGLTLLAGFAFAGQTAAANNSTASSSSDTSSTTRPSNKFPTPAELMAKIKAAQKSEDAEDALPKVAYFDLSRPMLEKPADFNWLSGDQSGLTLRVLIQRLSQARGDNDIKAVLLRLDEGSMNMSQAMELRDAVSQLRKAAKPVFVYADAFDTDSYIAASTASDIYMLEGGDIMVPGIGFETLFAKDLLDKIGVKADFVQIGEYKGADEEYTRSAASDELRGQLNGIADALYNQIISTISASRGLSSDKVKAIVDDSLIVGADAKNAGLVDELVDAGGVRDLLAKKLGSKIDLVTDYGQDPHDSVDLSSPFAFFSFLSRKPTESDRPGIAVIYAEGVIVDGEGGSGLLNQSDNIGSDTMREALREAEKDSKIKAVVIRIDSPGGSALASEAMWQAARRVARAKPVIISVGSMAASGGYYLASAGDFIFADPTAIVGSIGVVGGKFVYNDLFAKIGLTSESFARGRNADLFSSSTEWNDQQRAEVTAWMKKTYDQFTQRVMTTRKGKISDIDAVARGRIFSADQAIARGMVDRIGGIQDSIDYAAAQSSLKTGEYDVRVLPPARTLADLLNGSAGEDDSSSRFMPRPASELIELLSMLPPTLRHVLGLEINELTLLERSPVILASPVLFVVR